MNCKDLQGIDSEINCGQNMPGIESVFMFPFNDIDQYTYTNNNLDKVTGYSALSLPATYNTSADDSSYSGSKSLTDYRYYDGELTLGFQRLSQEKRNELKRLEHMDLTIIFKDNNGYCWIMGQHIPVRLGTVNMSTGTSSGQNIYQITFVSRERQHLREIECPSTGCFTSFTGTEYTRTTFVIPNSGSFAWDYLDSDVNGTLVTLDLSLLGQASLDPSVWNSNPSVLAYDRTQLINLFTSAGGIVNLLTTTHDDLLDITTISIDSTATAYGTLQVDNTVFNKDSFEATLNLKTILSIGLANASSIIEVTDDLLNVVYSGGYGNILVGPNITGTTDDATLIMSNLYPNGTTLTIELTNIPCSTVSYTYNYINTLEACTLDRTHEFNKDYRSKVHVPYLIDGGTEPITQRYQDTSININGVSFQLYKNYTTWHDDFTTFVNDVTLKFYQVNLPIDLNSLVFTDTGTGVDIEFNVLSATQTYLFKEQVVGYNQTLLQDDWLQGRVVNMQTIAPVGSTVTHTDSHTHTMIGENFINITSNDFTLGFNTLGNTTVDNVSVLWAFDNTVPYGANDVITTNTLGGNCNTPTYNEAFDTCYDDFISTFSSTYELISLDVGAPTSINMGNTFEMVYNNGSGNITVNFVTPSSVTPNDNVHYLINQMNNVKGLQVIHYDFEILERRYIFHLKMEIGFSLISFKETTLNRTFDLGPIEMIHINTLTNKMNPFIELSWTLPTNLPSVASTSQDLRSGYWQMQDNYEDAIDVNWNQTNDELVILKKAGDDNEIKISLHEDYPTSSNQVLFTVLFTGVTNSTVSNVVATIAGNGGFWKDVKYISYTNNMGWRQVQPIDLVALASETLFQELTQVPIAWGTVDDLSYIGSQTLIQPEVFSGVTSCFDCCGGVLIPSGFPPANVNFVTEEVSTNVFRIGVEFTEEVSCDISYLTLEIDNTNAPIPNPLEIELRDRDCINGNLTFTAFNDNLITFPSDPSTTENDVTVSMYDSSDVLLGTFELELSNL